MERLLPWPAKSSVLFALSYVLFSMVFFISSVLFYKFLKIVFKVIFMVLSFCWLPLAMSDHGPSTPQVWAPQSCHLIALRRQVECSAPRTTPRRPWWRRGATLPRALGWRGMRSGAWQMACSSSTASARQATASQSCSQNWYRLSGWMPWSPCARTSWSGLASCCLPPSRPPPPEEQACGPSSLGCARIGQGPGTVNGASRLPGVRLLLPCHQDVP